MRRPAGPRQHGGAGGTTRSSGPARVTPGASRKSPRAVPQKFSAPGGWRGGDVDVAGHDELLPAIAHAVERQTDRQLRQGLLRLRHSLLFCGTNVERCAGAAQASCAGAVVPGNVLCIRSWSQAEPFFDFISPMRTIRLSRWRWPCWTHIPMMFWRRARSCRAEVSLAGRLSCR
ncbi:hypothetical protein CJD44_00075 [Streptomyces sp. alain-838]|nr:hypothetical protein CJD44_00075 [Streptomyces sp. alain-838]